MNWTYANATLALRAVEDYIKAKKNKFKKVTNILAGKNMGCATLTKEKYSESAVQSLKDTLKELTQEIDQSETFARELRAEIASLSEGVETPHSRANGHAAQDS